MSSLTQRILVPALAALFVGPAFGQQPPPWPPAPAQPAWPPAPSQPATPAWPPAVAQPAAPLQPPGQAVSATTVQDVRAFASTGWHQPQSMNFATPLYQNPNVSRALNLSNAQLSRLRDTTTRIQAQYRNEALPLVNLNPLDRAARMQALERNYNNELMKHVGRVFTPEQMTRYLQLEQRNRVPGVFADVAVQRQQNMQQAQPGFTPEQMGRYRQMGLQSRGAGVFADIAVQRQLNLTRDQRDSLRAIDEQTSQALREMARNTQGNRVAASRRYEAILRDTDNQINSVLSPDQRRAWQEMIGGRSTSPPDFDQLGR